MLLVEHVMAELQQVAFLAMAPNHCTKMNALIVARNIIMQPTIFAVFATALVPIVREPQVQIV